MKLHAQNQLYTSISFWDIKTLKTYLGMPDHTHQNLHNQFTTLIDINLHAQNQFYTTFNLMASLGMLWHAWTCSPKITSSICSLNRYVPAYKKSTL